MFNGSHWLMVLGMILGQLAGGIDLEFSGSNPFGEEPLLVKAYLQMDRGLFFDESLLMVTDASAKPCPMDLIPWDRWEDGSIRRLSLQTVVKARQTKGKLRIRKNKRGLQPLAGITCSHPRGGLDLIVDTGSLKAHFSPVSNSLVSSLCLKGKSAFNDSWGGELEISLNGQTYRSIPPRQVRVEPGQAAVTVTVSGATRTGQGEEGPSYAIHFILVAQSTQVRCLLRVEGASHNGACDGMRLNFCPSSKSVSSSRLRLYQGGEEKPLDLTTSGTVWIRSIQDRLQLTNNDVEVLLTGLCDLRVDQEWPRERFRFLVPRFKDLHPWALKISPECWSLAVLGESFLMESDLICERAFSFSFARRSLGSRSRPSPPFRAGAEAFALTKEAHARSWPFARLQRAIFSDPLYPLYLEVTGALRQRLRREWSLWNGFGDYGDYRTYFGQFANAEFDPVYGLLKRFLLHGNSADLEAADTIMRHWLCFDRTGYHDSSYPPGIPWMHGEEHRSGEIEAGHIWVDGLLLFGWITGDKDCFQQARCIGDYLAQLNSDGQERSDGWRLLALCALDEAGLSGYRPAMDDLAREIRQRQQETGYFRYAKVVEQQETFYQVNAWVTAGITLEALYRHTLLTGDPRSMEAVVRAGKWLRKDCFDPQTGLWCTRLRYPVSEPHSLALREGPVFAEETAFLALGLARAGSLSSNGHLLKYARVLLENGLRKLKGHPPAYPGKALSMVLRSAPEILLSRATK